MTASGQRRRVARVGVIVSFVVGALLLAPVLIVGPMSFTRGDTVTFPPQGFSLKWYRAIFEQAQWTTRLPVSFDTAMATTVLATTLGTMLAIGLSRATFRSRSLVWLLVLGPLLVPIVVLATGEFFVMADGWRAGPIHVGGHMVGTLQALILAHTVLALPYPTILVSASLRGLDPDLELAAASLGANPWTRFRRILLPLIAPGVIAGAVFAFLTSWEEVVMASFLTSGRLSTVPVQIFTDLNQSLDPTAAAISSLLLVVSLLGAAAIAIASRNRRTRATRTYDSGADGT
jgi:putative spermidine/putrescine transport system permease protein